MNAFNGDKYLVQMCLDMKKRHGIKTIIETGTYQADTTLWMAENFDYVFTIEVNKQFFDKSAARLAFCPNVVNRYGDTEQVLPNILAKAPQPMLIFLDAHWYKNPLLGELEIIADFVTRHPVTRPCIMIHDFMVPGKPELEYDVYENEKIIYNWDYVKAHIEKIYGPKGYRHYYNSELAGAKRGCLFVEPVTYTF